MSIVSNHLNHIVNKTLLRAGIPMMGTDNIEIYYRQGKSTKPGAPAVPAFTINFRRVTCEEINNLFAGKYSWIVWILLALLLAFMIGIILYTTR
jgi:NADH:ubiquinone oxidoreductase subunit 6 (subunit J)